MDYRDLKRWEATSKKLAEYAKANAEYKKMRYDKYLPTGYNMLSGFTSMNLQPSAPQQIQSQAIEPFKWPQRQPTQLEKELQELIGLLKANRQDAAAEVLEHAVKAGVPAKDIFDELKRDVGTNTDDEPSGVIIDANEYDDAFLNQVKQLEQKEQPKVRKLIDFGGFKAPHDTGQTYKMGDFRIHDYINSSKKITLQFKPESQKFDINPVEGDSFKQESIDVEKNNRLRLAFADVISSIDPEKYAIIPDKSTKDFFIERWDDAPIQALIASVAELLAAKQTKEQSTFADQIYEYVKEKLPGLTRDTFNMQVVFKKVGEGYRKRRRAKVTGGNGSFRYYRDPQQLALRAQLLTGALAAGNDSPAIKQELMEIYRELGIKTELLPMLRKK